MTDDRYEPLKQPSAGGMTILLVCIGFGASLTIFVVGLAAVALYFMIG